MYTQKVTGNTFAVHGMNCVSDACHLRKPASEHFHVLLENTAEISLLDMLLMQRACLLPDNVNMFVFLAENVEK